MFILLICFVRQAFQWLMRIRRVSRTVPVVPVLLPHYSLLRRFWPASLQTYHPNWQFHKKKSYDHTGSHIFALISLFGHDTFFVSDAEIVREILSDGNRFPKDVRLYGNILESSCLTIIRNIECVWTECSHNRRVDLEKTSEDNFTDIFRQE